MAQERVKKVLANCVQGLGTDEQRQARENIGAQATLVAGQNITIDQATNTISATVPPGAFIGTYTGSSATNTPYADYLAAWQAGKPVFVKYTINRGDVFMQMDQIDEDKAIFARTVGHVSSGNYGAVSNTIIRVDAHTNEYTFLSTQLATGTPVTLEWEQNNQGGPVTYDADRLTIHQDFHTVTMHGSAAGTGDPNLGFLAPPMQNAPSTDKVLKVPSGSTVPVWDDFPAGPTVDQTFDGTSANAQSGVAIQAELDKKQKTLTAGSGITITPGTNSDTVAWEYSVGRNLHVNQNNAIQTNLPGGIYNAPTGMSNSFTALQGADFAGAFRLGCRHNTNGTYELALIYTASGMSTAITFIGTETVIGTDNSVTAHAAAYIGESAYYTPSMRFGGTASTPFNPTSHKAIIYDGIAQIGPTSDCKIAIWNDNGTVKVSFTAIEVGKVGSTV